MTASKFLLFLLCLLSFSATLAQPCTGMTIADADVSRRRLVRQYYDDDAFAGTDRYFTRGIRAELIHPQFRDLYLAKRTLFRLGGRPTTYYGLGVAQAIYTPENLTSPDVVLSDRPYAGTLSVQHFLISNDLRRKLRMTNWIDIGVLGPLSGSGLFVGANENPDLPQGWENQIHTDLLLGYGGMIEKGLISVNGIDAVAFARANLGTVHTYAGGGLLLRLGLLNPYFHDLHFTERTIYGSRDIRHYQFFLTARGEGRLVGYDGTLQGGLINRSSPHTIAGSELKRFLPLGALGLTFSYKIVELGYEHNFAGARFDGVEGHTWGQLRLVVAF
jgi:lipid A 3-O-deacylase